MRLNQYCKLLIPTNEILSLILLYYKDFVHINKIKYKIVITIRCIYKSIFLLPVRKEGIVFMIKTRLWQHISTFFLHFVVPLIRFWYFFNDFICMYAYMCVCLYFCSFLGPQSHFLVFYRWSCSASMWECEQCWAQCMLSIQLPFGKYVTGHLSRELHSFLYKSLNVFNN